MRADYSLKERDPQRMAHLECRLWGGVSGSFAFLVYVYDGGGRWDGPLSQL